MFKRHYIDGIEYPPSPICGGKPKFESNVTSFQFRQNASAQGWPPRRFGGDNSFMTFLLTLLNIFYSFLDSPGLYLTPLDYI